MFQVNGFEVERDIPDFRDLRSDAMEYMRSNASRGVYWETLSKEICSELKTKYPGRAISCQLFVYPGGDPGFHSRVHTIGGMEPLAIPGPMSGAGYSDS